MEPIILNAGALYARADVYRALREPLRLPDYFGNNADALYDELTGRAEKGCVIVVGAAATVAARTELKRCLRVLTDCGWTWEKRTAG